MKKPLIVIGESIHASIPKTAEVMRQLVELGLDAYTARSESLDYIKNLIESQAARPEPGRRAGGADYIAVNLDAFGEDDPKTAINMMREYVKLVRKWGNGVPVCIDSSDDDVLKAGLKEWYNTSEDRGQKPALSEVEGTEDRLRSSIISSPLINSVKIYTIDKMLPLKKARLPRGSSGGQDFDFAFIGLLMSEDKPEGPGGSHSVDELYSLAQQIFDAAVGKYGFKPDEIYFDSTVFPLAIDMPMTPGVSGYTYRTFETIKKIKSDPKMKAAHCVLGVSNCVRDLPGRKIGVCRAYVAKAMEYGLDAVIANVEHHYGSVEPAGELLELVDAYAKMDGSTEKTNKAMELMSKFCQENRKQTK